MSTTRASDIAKPSASIPKESTRILPIKPSWRRYCATVRHATLSFVSSIIHAFQHGLISLPRKLRGCSQGLFQSNRDKPQGIEGILPLSTRFNRTRTLRRRTRLLRSLPSIRQGQQDCTSCAREGR